MSDEREVHHEDPELAQDVARLEPPETVHFYEEEAGALFAGGKSNALDGLIHEMLAKGHRLAPLDSKADPDLATRLENKRAEIERDLPGLYAEMAGDNYRSPNQWKYADRIWDGTSYIWPASRYGSMIQRPFEGQIKLKDPDYDSLPVRVGDVVRIIDTQYGCRPVPGHVVGIDGWWITVAGPLGRRQTFFGSNGYLASEYRWRLEPYITEEESNR